MKRIKIPLFIHIGLLPFIVLFLVFYIDLNFSTSSLAKILDTFDNTGIFVYSSGKYVIYNNNIYDTALNIEWIEDEYIIYSKKYENKKEYYLLDNSISSKLLYSSNNISEYEIIYKDSILYFISSDDSYNKYDNNTLTKINKSDYYVARDGNKYTIDINYKNDSNEIESIIVKDNISNTINIIDIDLLLSNNLMKKAIEYGDINIINYYVFNEELYVQIKINECVIMLRYDSGIINYCDSYYGKNCDARCFFINDLKMPLLRYIK